MVSRGFSSTSFFAMLSFLANVVVPVLFTCPRATQPRQRNLDRNLNSISQLTILINQAQSPIPARGLEDVCYRVSEVVQFITHRSGRRGIGGIFHRPVDQQRPSDDICLRYEAPVAAIVTVVPIVSHYKIMSLGNDQLSIFDQLVELYPPLGSYTRRDVEAGKIVAEYVVGRWARSARKAL